MADTKTASLTVLGGPLAGSRCVLPEDGSITIGSEVGSTLRLDLPSVSPSHARVVVEPGHVTVYGTGVGREVHVNDNPVGSEGTVLRNGDILWLGSPGADDVVMLQCVLPRRPGEAPSPATVRAVVPTPEVETLALWAAGQEPSEQSLADVAAEGVAEATATTSDEAMAILPEEGAPAGEAPMAVTWEDERLVVAGEAVGPAVEDEVVFAADEAGELRTAEPVEAIPEEAPEEAVAEATEVPAEATPPDVPEEPAVEVVPEGVAVPVVADAVEEAFVAEASATVMMAEDQEVVEAVLPPAPAEPPPAAVVPQPTPGPVVGKPAAPAPPPSRPRTTPPHSRPSARPSAASARREPRSAPARSAAAAVAPGHAPADAPRPRGGSRMPWLAAAGLVGVLVVAGLGWVAWSFLAAPSGRSTSPTPLAQATPPPAPVSATPEEVLTPPPTPETTPLVPDAPTPAPTASPTASPTPTPRATPTPAGAAVRPTPTPTPPPAASGPSAETLRQQRAAQVEQHVGQAETALGSRQYDQAVSSLDEALRLEPDNDRAASLRADAVRRRDLARRRFVAGRTSVQTEKAQGAALTGFETGDADLRKAPDFLGRIEFEMSPASGIEAGDAWTLKVYVVNEGRKPIRVQGVTVGTTVNGAGSGGAVPARAREIAIQQRALVAEAAGSWRDGTTAWATEVTVSAGRGDSLKNTITWR